MARLDAFFKSTSKSSGIEGATPADFIIFVIDLFMMGLVSAIPCLSRSMVPILLGLLPSFANLITSASTSSGAYFDHGGGRLLTGRDWCELPFSVFGNRDSLQVFQLSDRIVIFKTFVKTF
jgi:hypothetical protein